MSPCVGLGGHPSMVQRTRVAVAPSNLLPRVLASPSYDPVLGHDIPSIKMSKPLASGRQWD